MALSAGLPVAVIAVVIVLAAFVDHVSAAAAAHSSSSSASSSPSSTVRSSSSSSASASGVLTFGPSTFIVPGAFPTSVYSRYYNNPTATASQVQPVITDPVTGQVYPFELTNPLTVPIVSSSPHFSLTSNTYSRPYSEQHTRPPPTPTALQPLATPHLRPIPNPHPRHQPHLPHLIHRDWDLRRVPSRARNRQSARNDPTRCRPGLDGAALCGFRV